VQCRRIAPCLKVLRIRRYGVRNERNAKMSRLYAKRRRALMRRIAGEHKLDTVLITNQVDIRYLSGATEGVSALLLAPDTAVVFTSKMFETRVPKEASGCEIIVDKPTFKESAVILGRRRHRKAVGFQGGKLVQTQYVKLASAMGRRKLVDIGDSVTQLRAIKDPAEIRLIKQCIRIAEQAFLDLIRKGATYLMTRTERQLAAELEYRMCMLGADRQAFPFNGIIAASGPNSASCHHFPGSRKPKPGEPLLFDWGAEKNGYRCDITRVVFMGKPDSQMRKIFEVVSKANSAGINAIRPGTRCAHISSTGWNVVRNAGFGDLIRHGLGHGFGLDIHEPPGLGSGGSQSAAPDSARMKKNMVVTVEPGIYIEGKGGVRLEDDVLVTATGHKVLTSLPTDLKFAVLRR
jgi:Xaa-Pro aminopeptidase